MKQLLYVIVMTGTFAFAACNNNGSKNEHDGHDMSKMETDTAQHASAADDKDVKTVAVVFNNADPKAAAGIKEIVDHYLHIKNALANDNAGEAVIGAKAMGSAIDKLDKSLLTAEQKSGYDASEKTMKEQAVNIAKSSDNINEQRLHFAAMSEAAYLLVKNFGAGRSLYHDHCPMAKDNQGAMWLSEVKEIKNPYFGSAMSTCGSVEEVIQ